jgi:catecholate siderophore receptor
MTYIKSRQHVVGGISAARAHLHRHPVVGTLGLMLAAWPGLALAQSTTAAAPAAATEQSAPTGLPVMKAKASANTNEGSYKADVSASAKLSQPLLDTPKTVQVIKKEVLAEQGAATLMEALRNTPGITMQLGEGGNTSAGDTFQLRGFAAQTATYVDGVRDLAAVTRDTFNIEQVEVVRGPAGAEGGRGASSGYINLISKLPTLDHLNEATVALGSASRKRATSDLGLKLGENAAARLNLVLEDSGVPGRDVLQRKTRGIAPALAFGLGTGTRLYLHSQHLRQDNVPDGGIPTVGMSGYYNTNATVAAAARADSSNFYGSVNDRELVKSDQVTTRLEHALTEQTKVQNISRYGKTRMDRVLTSVGAASLNSSTGAIQVARSRQRVDQTNEVLANQTNVNTQLQAAGLRHDISAGLEFIYERQLSLGAASAKDTINGVDYAAINNPAADLYNPNANDDLGIPYLTGASTEGKTMTAAAYLFDTVSLSDAWKLSGGLRLDRYHLSTQTLTVVTSSNTTTYPGYAVGSIAPTTLTDGDDLISWNLGAVYKPAPNGTVYLSVANSLTPPGGANFTLSATTTNQASPTLKPQETRSLELGSKWDLLDKRLNLSSTLYRSINNNQTSEDPTTRVVTQFGKTRVEGLELAAVGQITNFWQLSAGLAKMRTKQLDQYSVATTGVVTTTNAVRWSPDLSLSAWSSYTLNDLTLGGGVRYVSSQKRAITNSPAAANMPGLPGYSVTDVMAAYRVSRNLNLQLNVYNLFDREYVSSLNNNGSRVLMGTPRNATLTARVQF